MAPGVFAVLSKAAKKWLRAPTDDGLARLAEGARVIAPAVPEARRADWERLVGGFAKEEDATRRRARVEALVRACALFEPPPELSVGWEDAVDRLPGLGDTARRELAARGVRTIADLVWTLPVAWDDLRAPIGVAEAHARAASAEGGRSARLCVSGVVKSAGIVPMRGRRAVHVVLEDPAAKRTTLHLWWFFAAHGVLAVAKPGAACLVVGRVRATPPKPPLIAHPELFADTPEARIVRPRYPRLGVAEALLRKAIARALGAMDALPDPVPAAIAAREAMPEAAPLLRAAHAGAPTEAEVRVLLERLAWIEAFARVWERLRAEERQGEGKAPAMKRDRAAHARFLAELGFAPTAGQAKAIEATLRDLGRTQPMRRLLLGDVGTGKTAVALAAAAQAVASGHQVAFLVPTTILAEQYLDAAAPLARATGAKVALVAAGVPAASRRRVLEQVAAGAIDVVVGTHALLGEGVRFARLGLVVVDEQHRLGVAQRLALVERGEAARAVRPHLLTLSATPIPRTLALALRGELATSVLDERPRGRPPVATSLAPRANEGAVIEEMRAACARGERVFFVAPRIEDADDEAGGDADAAPGCVARAEELAKALAPAKVALVHGAMPAEEKRRAMRAFRAGEAQVLVGTTVVEVGIDVPEATLMVIDGAERFGLAQLHQMRGRVGRGAKPGRCVLLHADEVNELARKRLEAVRDSNDGFAIAKADLALRGPGDLGGTRQSGAEGELVYLDPAAPPEWLPRVDADARAIFAEDPELSLPAHRALALAVRRFETEVAIREEAG